MKNKGTAQGVSETDGDSRTVTSLENPDTKAKGGRGGGEHGRKGMMSLGAMMSAATDFFISRMTSEDWRGDSSFSVFDGNRRQSQPSGT